MSQIFRESRYSDFHRHASEGRLPGVIIINEFGQNTNISDTAKETLHDIGGLYHWIDSPTILNISSNNANDTLAGSGAQKVLVSGLDGNWNIISETVDMDGTNTAQTTKSFYRVYNFQVSQAGVDGYNVGQLTMTDDTSSLNTIETIPAEQGKSHSATYTIPANYTGYIVGWFGSERSKQGVTLELWTRDIESNVFKVDREAALYGTEFERNFIMMIKHEAKTDIEIRSISAQSGGFAAGGFAGYVEHYKVKGIY